MLKRTLTSEEHTALASEWQALYAVAADGNGYTLDVDPDPALHAAQTKLGEMRENNIAQKKQLDKALQEKSPPENAALQEQVADLARGLQEEREGRKHDKKLHLDRHFQLRVAEIATKCGVIPEGITDMISRARTSGFRVESEDGTVAAFKSDNAVMSKRDPSVRLTLTEWMNDQRRDGAGHLFKPSRGTDGRPQESTGTIIDGVLHNPSESEFGRNLADIASGKIQVGETRE